MNLKVTIIQTSLFWEDADKNRSMFSEKIQQLQTSTDVIVLPEMFTTGFSMESEKLAETMDGKTVAWMKEMAQQTRAAITGSLIIAEKHASLKERGVRYYNRLIWVQPDGVIYTYNKRHLFRMANEQEHFSMGTSRLIITWKGWKICPLICYDLRFPVWSRNKEWKVESKKWKEATASPSLNTHHSVPNTQTPTPAYDCLLYVANWPEARKEPWCKLLEARAIENQTYVIGVNRVGTDGNGINYSGNSMIIDPKGNDMGNLPEHEESVITLELHKQELEDFRKKFPVALDADEFDIKQ